MYNPFSIYTVVPWAIVFNLTDALILILFDLLIGAPFNNSIKGPLCLVLFIINLLYILYTIVIHFSVLTRRRCVTKQGHYGVYPITFTDLFNILLSAALIWVWLFMALYFFDKTMYTDVLSNENQPHTFYKVYFKFYAFTVIALSSGVTTILPLVTLSQMAQALGVLYFEIITILVLAGFLTYVLDMIKDIPMPMTCKTSLLRSTAL